MEIKRVMLVGGGSGGHFYPLMAIAEALIDESRKRNGVAYDLYYIGPDAYDVNSLTELNISFVSCPAGKRRKYAFIRNPIDFVKSLAGIWIALVKLFTIYPDVLISKGGYTSVPVVVAAWLLRIPIVIHESDAKPGRANLFGSKFARSIAISYPDTQSYFNKEKTGLTGIPIRKALLEPASDDARSTLGIESLKPTILVLGGSQGAERVNEFILESLDELLPLYTVIHQTGPLNFETVSSTAKNLITDAGLIASYYPVAFLDARTLNQAMHVADIILSRAGSTSIFEIALHGKPSILIPIPEEVSHDQRTNAYAYARTGATTVMEEGNLKDGLLSMEIARIMGDSQMYKAMSEAALCFGERSAATKIALALIEIAEEH